MKKNLFKILLATFVFTFGVVVYANEWAPGEPLDEYSSDVTVGESLTGTLYSVEISWDNLTFDWIYDHWQPANTCGAVKYVDGEVVLGDGMAIQGDDEYGVFTDNKCTNLVESELKNGETYYINNLKREYVKMTIVDNSVNGQIIPIVRWEAEEQYLYYADPDLRVQDNVCVRLWDEGLYNFVKENNGELHSDSLCSMSTEDTGYSSGQYYAELRTWKDLALGDAVYETARRRIDNDGVCYTDSQGTKYCYMYSDGDENVYDLRFDLDTAGYIPEDPNVLPTVGDTIGTITIEIHNEEQ